MENVRENIKVEMGSQYMKDNILRTLLYYDIFKYPLKLEEIYFLLPFNSIEKHEMIHLINKFSNDENSLFSKKNEFVYVKPYENNVELRLEKEKYSKKMWKIAWFVTHIIKRFPFVRSVLVTGTLSKNSSFKGSDLDFMVITAKNRLWVTRTLLMLFKKLFLLNSHKYFCINYFISEDKLEIEEKNLFTATEIVHLKATYNSELMNKFIMKNEWVKNIFPNYKLCEPYLHHPGFKVNNRKSFIQKIFELVFIGKAGSLLDNYLMQKTSDYFKRKYTNVDKIEHEHMFKSTRNVSKTHPLNMQKKILMAYNDKLKKFNLEKPVSE